jgi:hypothetical protein
LDIQLFRILTSQRLAPLRNCLQAGGLRYFHRQDACATFSHFGFDKFDKLTAGKLTAGRAPEL